MRKAIFLDRDGVINRDLTPYVTSASLFNPFPWAVEALTLLNNAQFDIYVVSNQQGVALGYLDEAELAKMDAKLQEMLAPYGFQIKKMYYCLARDEDNHPWRKPGCGMIVAAGEEFGFDPRGCFLIGDKDTDLMAAAAAGCRPLLVLSGVTSQSEVPSLPVQPEAVFPTLLEAAQWVAGANRLPPA